MTTLHPLAIFGGLFTLLAAALIGNGDYLEGAPLLVAGFIMGVLGTTAPCDETTPVPYVHKGDDDVE